MNAQKLILASASPRRRELLALLGLAFEVFVGSVDETLRDAETAAELVSRLAKSKAEEIARRHPEALVLAADTTVAFSPTSLRGDIFEKPVDRADAERMLKRLSGKNHVVLTAIALKSEATGVFRERTVLTEVYFRNIKTEELRLYIASGEPLDKAGAYGIQGVGGIFVEKINGSYSNVVGLPLVEVQAEFSALGFATQFPVSPA